MQIEYFRLIDRIIALDLAARTIQVEANVPTESTIFEGHFPGYPLMPGVLLLETMAQASGWLVIGITKFTCMPFFAAVKEAKFRSFVTPGMALTVNATLEHEGSGYAVTRAEIRGRDGSQDKLLCNAEITFRLVPFPSPQFRDSMEKVAAAISFPMELAANG
jgi:3-hydroxyacyl-[acyl-carrier-protein] dehydratase